MLEIIGFHTAIAFIAVAAASHFGNILAADFRHHGFNRYTIALGAVMTGQAALVASAILSALGTAATAI